MNASETLDVELARHNMIEQQIRPWNVLDQGVLDAMTAVPREQFVPPAYRSMAFTDTEIPLDIDGQRTGQSMFAPRLEARFLQALAIGRHETVVEIGTGSGFMAALLAHEASQVDSYEIIPELAEFARANLAREGVSNCQVHARSGADLLGDTSWQADVILLSGAVESVPAALIDRLRAGGRLGAVVGRAPIMTAQILRLGERREVATEIMFETLVRPLRGFPVGDHFRF
ncbi:MAG: protein-L-isoaspartate O-methyltransferase [Burkholderiaceae bacterium]